MRTVADSQQKTMRIRWNRISPLCVAAFAVALLFVLAFSSFTVSPKLLRSPLSACLSDEILDRPPSPKTSDRDYDLAAILNVRAFKSLRDHQSLDTARVQREAASRPGSIIAIYANGSSGCSVYPSVARLRTSTAKYFMQHHQVESFQIRDITLVIHHDPVKLDMPFVRTAVDFAKRFRRVRLLIPDPRLAKRFPGRQVIVHEKDTSDDTIGFMLTASHLLVHTGEKSALGALISEGTVYYTHALSEYTSQNAFKWLVNNRIPLSPEKFSPYVPSLNYVGHVRPTCCDFRPFGRGDEERAICVSAGNFKPPCWILAVGSAGKFNFEADLVSKTECHVHTFDCTGDWQVPKDISHRVTLHKLCLGGEHTGLFRTMKELIEIGSNAVSGLGELKPPAFVKMDIEGYEFPVIRAVLESTEEEALPPQIVMEVHQRTGRPIGPPYVPASSSGRTMVVPDVSISQFFSNLSAKGYDLVYRSDNPFCPHCSEVTVVRRDALPAD